MKRIILDTDTGVDDALAIILALNSPELSVEAITTVAGNVEVEKCTRNCLLVLDLLNHKKAPIVAQGAKKPLVRKLVTAPEVHGNDGFGNIAKRFSEPRHRAVSRHAVDVILDVAKKHRDRLTIVATGPLTNIALAIRKNPAAMKNIKEIIAMGGAFGVPGNTGPVAEFNMFVDPEAAAEVLRARLSLMLVPLDVTEQVILYWKEILKGEKSTGNRFRPFISDLTRFYMKFHKRALGFFGGYLHDPLTVGVAIKRSLVRTRPAYLTIETKGVLTRGMTVAELRPKLGKRRPNAVVAVGVDNKAFLHLFRKRVLR